MRGQGPTCFGGYDRDCDYWPSSFGQETCSLCGHTRTIEVSARMARAWVALTSHQVAEKIDALDASDPERAHGDADEILLDHVDIVVASAYRRLIERCDWWA